MGSFGENLRRERELRGVSLREIADNTKISIRFLEALEEDRVDVLPGGLFPRSFVRQYATFVGLDPDRTVADAWQTSRFPESFLVDADGMVVERYVGPRTWDGEAYVERIRALLAVLP